MPRPVADGRAGEPAVRTTRRARPTRSPDPGLHGRPTATSRIAGPPSPVPVGTAADARDPLPLYPVSDASDTQLTRDTYERLQAELEDLTTRGRVEIAAAHRGGPGPR